jgi:hypothetical protein
MKNWQHGISLTRLKNYEKFYTSYNKSVSDPFHQVKKHIIASQMHKGTFFRKQIGTRDDWDGTGASLFTNISKSSASIYMANKQRVPFADVKRGDRVIKNLGYREPINPFDADVDASHIILTKQIKKYTEPTFLYIREGHPMDEMIADFCGFQRVGMKITSFGHLVGVWYREGADELPEWHLHYTKRTPRTFPTIDKTESYTIKKIKMRDVSNICKKLEKRLDKFDEDFTNHYSNYNEKNTWSAISLRGYRRDWRFISKPSEMSKKWKEENKNNIYRLQDTKLRKQFPEVEKLIKFLPGKVHRIRFMNLTARTGELSRHTDLVDAELGVEDGNLMRFHFPIKTNRKVMFSSWGVGNKETRRHMKVGGCYYLDIRKPHRAVNWGNQIRTHLVVDVVASQSVRELLG